MSVTDSCILKVFHGMARSGTLEYKTTIGFNVNQHLHYNTVCVDHPESPSRIDECRAMLQESGLLTECQVVEVSPASI